MKNQAAVMAVGAFVLSMGSIAHAQTDTTKQPTAIGTSQETANEAQRKAMQDPNSKATLVRTGPTAGERASEMTSKTKDKAGEVASDTKQKVKDTTGKARAKASNAADDVKNP